MSYASLLLASILSAGAKPVQWGLCLGSQAAIELVVNAPLLEFSLCVVTGVFGVVILLQMIISIRKFLVDKGQKKFTDNSAKQETVHPVLPTEQANIGSSFPADASPNVHFHRMFGTAFDCQKFLTFLREALPFVPLRLNSALVSKNPVRLAEGHLGQNNSMHKIYSFWLVGISDKLSILCSAVMPSKL